MRRESHVRFCEGGGVKFPSATRLIVGCEHRWEAERFLSEVRERFAQFGLELHPQKTRLIEFGRYARRDREQRGEGKPETFTFLGFTHICGSTRSGGFKVVRQTQMTRMRSKLKELKSELRRRLNDPVPVVGRWLQSVVLGSNRYYGVPGNMRAMVRFRLEVGRHWYRALRRRSQRTRLTWERMRRLVRHWLPPARIMHPYPEQRLCV